ncbi:Trk system potassium transporter TrkA [Myxococcota bacterium]|nr:Trk system potassium transporter TrkA [Myxococcota bacterium]MBU1432501.1 Trk system potassium transporter TrkA [Myxococcota bacterium]
MKILIIGAGQVGFKIASRLVEEGHDVIMVERDAAALTRATDTLDIQGFKGHGAHPNVLDEAGIQDVDMLVAATDSDEVNMVACLSAAILGKEGVIKIARVRHPSYLDARIFNNNRVAIDLAINPERVAAEQIIELLRYPGATEMIDFAEGRVRIVALRVVPTSPLAGLRFIDFGERFSGLNMLIVALHRGDEVIIPRGPDVILPGDEIYVLLYAGEEDEILSKIGIKPVSVSRVIIAGGTVIGRFIAEALSARGLHPKLIEPDEKLALELADALPEVVVLHGDPTDVELLTQENISEMEAFIACGRNEEANVMSGLLAMRLGARRILATPNRGDYLPLMKSAGFDVCISPRQVAVDSILHFIRHGRVLAARALGEEYGAEAIELVAQAGCPMEDKPLSTMRLPPRTLIACIQRGAEVLIPRGNTAVQAGDHVLVVAQREELLEIEALFIKPAGPQPRPTEPTPVEREATGEATDETADEGAPTSEAP